MRSYVASWVAIGFGSPFLYLLANGALDWGPIQRARRAGASFAADRTLRTTVRRVGLDGRVAPIDTEVAA